MSYRKDKKIDLPFLLAPENKLHQEDQKTKVNIGYLDELCGYESKIESHSKH